MTDTPQPTDGQRERCVFCEIASNTLRSQVLTEELGGVVAFRPLDPVTEGHVLIVPRRHVADALESPSLTGIVMREAAWYAQGWTSGRPAVGACNIITSVGREATQSIFHLHVHIVPRRIDDGLPLPWTPQQRVAPR